MSIIDDLNESIEGLNELSKLAKMNLKSYGAIAVGGIGAKALGNTLVSKKFGPVHKVSHTNKEGKVKHNYIHAKNDEDAIKKIKRRKPGSKDFSASKANKLKSLIYSGNVI